MKTTASSALRGILECQIRQKAKKKVKAVETMNESNSQTCSSDSGSLPDSSDNENDKEEKDKEPEEETKENESSTGGKI